MPKVTINGVTTEVPDGTSIIAAADRAGVSIPRFCYHPDLTPAGNCRICQVEIEGMPRLVVSCMTPVKDGMVVRTDTEKVKKAVRGDLEFLLLNHPVDCPICDQAGECYLQDFYMQVGFHESRIPLQDKVRKRKVVDLGPMIMLDAERCVMCSRCIRFSDEVTGTNQFGFVNRGAKTEISTFRDRPLQDAYSGCYADVCPVGALTSNDFRFQSRVWFLERADSVCPECSTGCNIRIDHKEGRAFRFLPRRNPEVNRSWMCDEGRQSYRGNHEPTRLTEPRLRRGGVPTPVDWPELEAELVAVVNDARRSGPGGLAGIASPRATLEELWLFRRLLRDAIGTPHLDWRVDPGSADVDVREDEVLRRRDKNPNSRGAELLGMTPGAGGMAVGEILDAAAAGRIQVLWLLGPELLTRYPDPERVARALAGARYVVMHDTHARPGHEKVHALVAAASFAEGDGSFVNHARRVQRIQRAFAAPGRARSTVETLGRLLEALGGGVAPRTAREAFRELARSEAPFAGLTHERLGPLGIALGAAPATGGQGG